MTVLPWYRRTLRWGQTNLTEKDPVRYDSQWWREYWRRTRVQGVIVNAGGIVAYYPSRYPLHHRAVALGERDLYGEIVRDARAEGLVVLARMDSNRADEAFYREHPDWFALDADGHPYRAGELYVACVSGPYYREYLPDVIREIIERSSPEGLTDNSWSGLPRDRICYCENCRRSFRSASGSDLPRVPDWDDPVYRQWISWSYQQRLAIWDLNNEVSRSAGGEDCRWIGMNGGDLARQSQNFRDYREICRRTPILMLDSQFRQARGGFQANADTGKLLHGLLGWDVVIPESTAMYDGGVPTFRLGSKPAPEARMWAVAGFAAGISPWWHHIGAWHEDRRQYATSVPMFEWHEENETYLRDRTPVATVGVVWSQQSIDFHGRDEPERTSMLPYRGVVDALIRARIPYLPVHIDDEEQLSSLSCLVLPNLGALSDAQIERLRAYASDGGSLVVTGETGRFDEWGVRRELNPLDGLLGVRSTGQTRGDDTDPVADWASFDGHSYLRREPAAPGAASSALLEGFQGTDLLPFGGRLEMVSVDSATEAVEVPLTWVPPFPIYPPEKSWMEQERTDLPAAVARTHSSGARTIYLAADVDRGYGRHHHPDHGRLVANAVRWATNGDLPLRVSGTGVLDCHVYRGPHGLVVHLVNLDQGGAWTGQLEELTPNGPYQVWVRCEPPYPGEARLLVDEASVPVEPAESGVTITVPRVLDHEVIVLTGPDSPSVQRD